MMNIRMKNLLLPLLSLAVLVLPAEAQQAVTIPRPDPAVAEFARGVKFTVNGKGIGICDLINTNSTRQDSSLLF